MLPVCPCLARRSLSPDSGVAAILSSLTQSPGEQSTLFHVVVQQLNTESRSVVSELQQAPEFALFTRGVQNSKTVNVGMADSYE